jgi:hypothetical protein
MTSLFSADVKVTREIARLDMLSEETQRRLLPTVEDLTERIAATSRGRAQSAGFVKTGRYLRSIRTRVRSDATQVKGRVIAGGRGSGGAHANLLEYGTKGHAILPQPGKRLRIELPTVGAIYARAVDHLGSRAGNILAGALDAHRAEVQSKITAIVGATAG